MENTPTVFVRYLTQSHDGTRAEICPTHQPLGTDPLLVHPMVVEENKRNTNLVNCIQEAVYQKYLRKVYTQAERDLLGLMFSATGNTDPVPLEGKEPGTDCVVTTKPDGTFDVGVVGKTLTVKEKGDLIADIEAEVTKKEKELVKLGVLPSEKPTDKTKIIVL